MAVPTVSLWSYSMPFATAACLCVCGVKPPFYTNIITSVRYEWVEEIRAVILKSINLSIYLDNSFLDWLNLFLSQLLFCFFISPLLYDMPAHLPIPPESLNFLKHNFSIVTSILPPLQVKILIHLAFWHPHVICVVSIQIYKFSLVKNKCLIQRHITFCDISRENKKQAPNILSYAPSILLHLSNWKLEKSFSCFQSEGSFPHPSSFLNDGKSSNSSPLNKVKRHLLN